MEKLVKLVIRLYEIAKNRKEIWRSGGITHVHISQINYGEILKGKHVLITGGSSGIGLAIAKKCLNEGAEVVITGRSLNKLEAVKRELNNQLLHILQWDISDVAVVEDRLKDALALLNGSLDILVNNAGVLIFEKEFPNITEQTWDITYATNSKGLFFLTQSVSKLWRANFAKGKIINISSTGGFLAANHPYRMTKWDVVGFTRSLGISLSPYGIIVNGIAPGRTATDMLNANFENIYDSKQPVRRFGLPEEMAELAVFLMSDAANYIVGQTIICDGGYTLRV